MKLPHRNILLKKNLWKTKTTSQLHQKILITMRWTNIMIVDKFLRVKLLEDYLDLKFSIKNRKIILFFNGLWCFGTPNHELFLKIGTSVMLLLRNIDHSNGLCNGTWLVIIGLDVCVLEAKFLGGHNVGDKVLVLRLSLTPSNIRLHFKFQHWQFPLVVSYVMIIKLLINVIVNCSQMSVCILKKNSFLVMDNFM